MSKFCPILNRKVVYLDCLECDDKQCENQKTKNTHKGENDMPIARMLTEKEVKEIREKYPSGTNIRLHHMDDPYPILDGMLGTVDFVDDGGNIWMKWLNGSTLALSAEVDDFEIIHPIKVTLEWDNETKLKKVFQRKSEAIVYVAEANTTCKEKKWFKPKVIYEDATITELAEEDTKLAEKIAKAGDGVDKG